MATFETQGISLYYELHGTRGKPPVLLISGLGGTGKSWGAQVERFARDHLVVLPDQRGTGQTTHAPDGYRVPQLASDFAALARHLDLGPLHVVGSSTGGAVAQSMALDHAEVVRSLTIGSSFARVDGFMRREFELRRWLVAEADPHMIYTAYALFLFSPRYTHAHPEQVAAWIERCAKAPLDRALSLKRIDMIMAHDVFARLGEIRQPTLIIGGDHDVCTPPQASDELMAGLPHADRVILAGGHLIHDEAEEAYFEAVRAFIAQH